MRFRTTLLLSGRTATGFVVPPEVVEPRARGIAPWRSPPVRAWRVPPGGG
jgi:hypothetical protein